MSITYILQNQEGYFLAKSGEWLDGREPSRLFKTIHQDEASNQLFEVNSKNINLRINRIACETTPKGLPIIPDDILPALTETLIDDNHSESAHIENSHLESSHLESSHLENKQGNQPENTHQDISGNNPLAL